jgi:hypothetical protein
VRLRTDNGVLGGEFAKRQPCEAQHDQCAATMGVREWCGEGPNRPLLRQGWPPFSGDRWAYDTPVTCSPERDGGLSSTTAGKESHRHADHHECNPPVLSHAHLSCPRARVWSIAILETTRRSSAAVRGRMGTGWPGRGRSGVVVRLIECAIVDRANS